MKKIFPLLILLLPVCIFAQTAPKKIAADTVMEGYYLPPDSNTVSFKLKIIENGKLVKDVNLQGNKLPDSLVQKIVHLKPGAVVIYDEITVMEKKPVKKPMVRYVIGKRNTKPAIRDPQAPQEKTREEIAALVLDTATVQFEIGWVKNGAYYTYTCRGNVLYDDPRKAVMELPAGTKVFVDGITQRFPDGSMKHMPARIYVVKNCRIAD